MPSGIGLLPASVSTVVGLALVVLTGLVLSRLVEDTREARRLRKSNLTDISSVQSESGRVEIEGEVQPTERGVLTAPVEGADAVVTYVRAIVLDAGEGESDITERHFEAVPFYLDDGTGRARIEIPDDDYRLEKLDRTRLAAQRPSLRLEMSADREFPYLVNESEGDPIPDEITHLFDYEFERQHDCEFREWALKAGDTVYVAGHAERAPTTAGADIVISGEQNPGDLVVGNSEEAVESSLYIKTLLKLLFVAFFFALGVLLVGAGVLSYGLL